MGGGGQHFCCFLFPESAIFRLYKSQVFFYCRRLAARIKTMEPKQLGGPVFKSSCVEGPTSHVGKALPLREIQLALLKSFLGAFAIFKVREGSVPSDNCSMLVPKWYTTHQKPSISAISGATKARLVFEKLTGRNA